MKATLLRQRGGFTSDTLRAMRELVNDWSKSAFCVTAARQICDASKAKTFEGESYAIWKWIRRSIAFRLDPVETQWLQDPYETMAKTKAGNCANMAILAGALLQAIGHPVSIYAIQWENRDDYSHAVIFDKLTGLIVDPVSPQFGRLMADTSATLEG